VSVSVSVKHRLFLHAAGAAAFLVVAVAGCYQASRPWDEADADASPDSGWPLPDTGVWPDGGQWWPDADTDEIGPVCPDPGPPVRAWVCDILAQDCGSGEGCYGWIEPSPDPCRQEVYRSQCLPGGFGGQGDPCDQSCQPGLECFITGEGTQCLYVCDILGSERRCPPGLICSPTDMPGVGACS
jgi:hypothetical protein